jgi:TIR domain
LDQFELAAGDSLRDALEEGLRKSDVLVTLVDPQSNLRPNLFFELGAAIGMGKRVVPIIPREADTSKLPFELRTRRYLLRNSPEDTAEELADALAAA